MGKFTKQWQVQVVANSEDLPAFNQEISALVEDGWKPKGGVSVSTSVGVSSSGVVLAQTMVKKMKVKKEKKRKEF